MSKFRVPLADLSENNYVRMKDGTTIAGLIRGEVVEKYGVWIDKKFVETPSTNADAKYRFVTNFILKQKVDGKYVSKLFEGGAMVSKGLRALEKAGYDLGTTWVSISRSGTGLKTVYTVMPTPVSQLTDEEKAELSNVVLQVIERKPAIKPVVSTSEVAAWPSEDDIPF